MIIQMMPSGLLVFAFALSLASASPKGDSLLELRKLMRQQDESSSIAATEQFNKDITDWAKGLEQLGLDMAEFVEKCRLPGSHCQQRRVLRQLRVLRRGYTDLRARLEALE
uniref:Uncharacterized protein LOC108038142 n=1 Tax=Drosophila rhopaloa TaxID=1041015 RepID=A0A6P4E531_DRORH